MLYELKNIIQAYKEVDFSKKKAALATVVKLYGSGYRRPGAKMLITDDGRWTGAVSGGCLEGDVLRKAREVMSDRKARIVVYDTMDDSDDNFGIGLGCNGIIDILIEPIDNQNIENTLEILSSIVEKQEKAIVATVINSKNEEIAKIGDRFSDYQSIENNIEKSQTLEFESYSVFFDVLQPDIQLIIFGAGYDALPLVNLAKLVGLQVTVTDDCVAHISPKRFEQANCLVYSTKEDFSKNLKITQQTAAVLISHNYKYDKAVLEYLLTTKIPYIGILGPKKRGEKLIEEIGIYSENDRQRIHSPVGLDIGAETPEEIALSIIAEIKANFANRTGNMLKFRNSGIHSELI